LVFGTFFKKIKAKKVEKPTENLLFDKQMKTAKKYQKNRKKFQLFFKNPLSNAKK
jgi:hypothetical protein